MKRRKFFTTLFGLAVAPAVIAKVLSQPAKPEIVVKSYKITSKPRKLKATWTVEIEQELASFHSVEVSEHLSKAIQKEIDAEILEILQRA